jgi:hypothetical protein
MSTLDRIRILALEVIKTVTMELVLDIINSLTMELVLEVVLDIINCDHGIGSGRGSSNNQNRGYGI